MEVIAMKKVIPVLLVMVLLLCSAALAEEGKVETFSAEYEMVGTTSSGQPKNDTFIFEGETTDGIITKLNFDIIRNKGSEDEYSKKDIMGYLMNISDATVEKTEDGYRLATLSAYGYDPAYSDGDTYYAQYMLTASCENLTEDTVFADLSFSDLAQPGNVVTVEKATGLDRQYLDLGDMDCLAVVSSQTYDSDGIMFEYTQSRHRPDYFRFYDNAVRR